MKKIILFKNIVMLALLLSACSDQEPDVSVSPRKEFTSLELLEKKNFTVFLEALEMTGLSSTIAGSPSTVFAPTNEAFYQYFDKVGVASLAEIDITELTTLISYHISAGEFGKENFGRNVSTVNGKDVYFVTEGALNINGKSEIGLSDLFSKEGVIHGVNIVLEPPAGNILDVLNDAGNFTILLAALEQTGLNDQLATGEFTILAPTDEAFENEGVTDPSVIDTDELTHLLSFHIFPGRIYTQEFPAGSRLATILGNETVAQQRVDIGSDLSFNGVAIETMNLTATNGVVHGFGALVFEDFILAEALSTAANITGGNDALGVDPFGALIDAVGYALFQDISLNHQVYTHLGTAAPGDFASNEEIIDYIERHIFDGIQIPALSNGTKIESIGGDEYYVAKIASTGFAYVNGSARNAFSSNTTSFPVYDGTVYLFNGGFTPLPEENIIEILSAQGNYSLFVKAAEIAGRTDALSSGNLTLLALNDVTFEAETGLDLADLEALDPDNEGDAATIADLGEIIDRHTINSVQFSRVLDNDLPMLTNVLGEDLAFAQIAGETVIVEDPKFPDVAFVAFEDVDILANNGVIHTVSKIIELE